MQIIFLFVLIVAATIGAFAWRGFQFRALAERGIPVTGTVLRKFRIGKSGSGGAGRRIAFSYPAPDGRIYRRAASVGRDPWSELEEGGPIDLVMLPDKPGVSAPLWLVDEARKALARRS